MSMPRSVDHFLLPWLVEFMGLITVPAFITDVTSLNLDVEILIHPPYCNHKGL